MSQWIFVCNPEHYDVIGAFSSLERLHWKQNANVEVGDTVYIYVGTPYKEIKYETIATEINLPKSTIDDTRFVVDDANYVNHNRYMELALVRTFETGVLPYTELQKNGLKTVQSPTKVPDELKSYLIERTNQFPIKSERRYFFVFQNKSYEEERQGEYLWAPQRTSNGHKVAHWERMNDIKKGDLIIHSVNRRINAVSIAQEDSRIEPRPEELPQIWANSGWKVKTNYYEIETPINISDHIENLLILQPEKQGPFSMNGRGKQGYLFTANKAMTDYIIEESIRNQESLSAKTRLQELLDYNPNMESHLDQDLVSEVDELLTTRVVESEHVPLSLKLKPEVKITEKGRFYPRDKQTALTALVRANFKCEIDPTHPSFIRKKANVEYTEPHHLIPMAKQDDFIYSLDVEANIVSLCSNCHNQIHYGTGSEEMIDKLYRQRKSELDRAGIPIALEALKSYY